MLCGHDDCLTVVTGWSHSGTTLMARLLIELGLPPLPEVADELRQNPDVRHGLEGRFRTLAHELCVAMGLVEGTHRPPKQIIAEIDALPARIVKAPVAGYVLPELVQSVPRIRHLLVVLRDPDVLIERAVKYFGYPDRIAARKDIYGHYGACFYACATWPVRWSWLRYPHDFDSRALGRVLNRAGLAPTLDLRDALARVWRPRTD